MELRKEVVSKKIFPTGILKVDESVVTAPPEALEEYNRLKSG